MLEIRKIVNGPIEENCWLAWSPGAKEAVLIDPGAEPEKIQAEAAKAGVKVGLILATHAHFDHVGAVASLAQAFQCPFALHEADLPVLEVLEDMSAFYGLMGVQKPKVDRLIKGREKIGVPGLELEAIPTPGHTPGGLCYYHAVSQSLFSGDTLFRLSIGRTDFEGGDHEALVQGVRQNLFTLPAAVKVYPGHGPATSIGEERDANPFVRG